MKILPNNWGQSLLETVFAIGILLIVVVAILALTISNIVGQKESEFQITANNLAREGIEVVRNIRDSNWLKGERWDDGLIDDGTAIPVFEYEGGWINQWSLDFNPDDPTTVYIFGGVYNQQSAGQSTVGSLTVYNRLLKFYNICRYTKGGNEGREEIKNLGQDCQSGNQEKVGLKIESLVIWTERERQRQVKLEDLLYAWK